MKILKVLAVTMIVIAAFSAGIGLSLFPRAATVFGAAPTPLSSVAHNATLAGSGTKTEDTTTSSTILNVL